MLPHQERVVEEKKQLDDKIEKLNSFFSTGIYRNLKTEEQERLQKQYNVMEQYSEILNERILDF